MREKNKSSLCVNDKRKDTENGGDVDSLKDETPTQKQIRYNICELLSYPSFLSRAFYQASHTSTSA